MALKGCSFANSPVRDRTICATRVRWPRWKSSKNSQHPLSHGPSQIEAIAEYRNS